MAALNTFAPFDAATVTLDEACTTELSNKSMVEIQGTSSPTRGRKCMAVHQEEITDDMTDDDDIHHLMMAKGNKWASNKNPQFKSANCQHCGKRGHLARVSRAILPADKAQAKQFLDKGTPHKLPKQGEDCFNIQRDSCQINPQIAQTNLSIKKKIYLTVKN
ncbi:hypothetical protein E2320_000281 [Naja naja]|nr:hypothetical protein E2320_000281 [Naja naja]